MARKSTSSNSRRLASPQSVNAEVKAICDIMRRSSCAGALQYVPELTWILFLRILDEQEAKETLTLARFDEFFRLTPSRGDSERSWTVTRAEIEARNFDLKAVNPNAKSDEDSRTPEELLDIIETKGREVSDAVQALRAQLREER